MADKSQAFLSVWKCEKLKKYSILIFFENIFLYFYSNEADKRSLLFSLALTKVLV